MDYSLRRRAAQRRHPLIHHSRAGGNPSFHPRCAGPTATRGASHSPSSVIPAPPPFPSFPRRRESIFPPALRRANRDTRRPPLPLHPPSRPLLPFRHSRAGGNPSFPPRCDGPTATRGAPHSPSIRHPAPLSVIPAQAGIHLSPALRRANRATARAVLPFRHSRAGGNPGRPRLQTANVSPSCPWPGLPPQRGSPSKKDDGVSRESGKMDSRLRGNDEGETRAWPKHGRTRPSRLRGNDGMGQATGFTRWSTYEEGWIPVSTGWGEGEE